MHRAFVPLTAAIAVIVGTAILIWEARPPGPLDQRMAYLMAWIAARSDYSANVSVPRVHFLPHEHINCLYHSRTQAGYRGQRNVRAFYDDASRTIWLPDFYDPRRHEDILVHELVHHLQHMHRRRFRCPAEREHEAYLIQARFVRGTGIGTMPSPGFLASLRC